VDTDRPAAPSTQGPNPPARRAPSELGNSSGERYIRVTLRLPACIEHRHLALNLVSAMIDHVQTTDRRFRDEMLTAFGEAFNNIVIHAYSGRADGMIEVEADLSPEQITIRLIDTGIEVDFSHVAQPDLDSVPEGGMGVFMIHALVDEVEYHGGAVNVLSLTKRTPTDPTARR
jgi:anti-sigma regulatory factor (Ser/Thr protein kinase)